MRQRVFRVFDSVNQFRTSLDLAWQWIEPIRRADSIFPSAVGLWLCETEKKSITRELLRFQTRCASRRTRLNVR
jgi:hypothetical protein